VRVRPVTARKGGVKAAMVRKGSGGPLQVRVRPVIVCQEWRGTLQVRVRPVTVRKGGVTPTVYKGVVRAGTSL